MHFGNGGLMLRLVIHNGVLGLEAEHHQFGVPSLSNFIPLMYDEKDEDLKYHFDRSYSGGLDANGNPIRVHVPKDPKDNSNNDVPIIWLHQQLNEIMDWFQQNPSMGLGDFQLINKLKSDES